MDTLSTLDTPYTVHQTQPIHQYTLDTLSTMDALSILVGHCLATTLFIGKLPAARGVWVIIG